jgi:hypothetical protein
MTTSFVVYIDESGDEGFRFGEGSTNWFILSAVITEKSTDLATVKLVDDVRLQLGRKADDKKELHFRRLKHEHRLPFLHRISQAALRTVTVMIHKPSIINVERYQERFLLYFYASRLLLERVSWCCRDSKTPHIAGDGSAEIQFSHRGGMKYEEFRQYMEKLRVKSALSDVRIDWDIINPNQITAYSPKLMGMQIADAVASGFFFSTQVNQYGFVEDRYARMLEPTVYHHRGRYNGYGIKVWPNEAQKITENQSELRWLKEVYKF